MYSGNLFVPNGGILKGKALEQVSKGQRPLAAGGNRLCVTGTGANSGNLFVTNGGILKGKALEQVSKGQRPLAAGGKNPNAVLVCTFASVV